MTDDISILEKASHAICRSHATGQCAAICLSSLQTSPCPHAVNVCGKTAKAVICAIAPAMEQLQRERDAAIADGAKWFEEYNTVKKQLLFLVTEKASK
jgi:hypothetical protein